MNHIEEKIIQTIDEHRDEIIAFAKDIQSHPEPGFYEERTAAHVAAFLRGLGLRVHGGLARTGVRAEWMEDKINRMKGENGVIRFPSQEELEALGKC